MTEKSLSISKKGGISLKKIIFLEGLPGVGKTTLIKKIEEAKIPNVHVVDEIIKKPITNTQLFFMKNDEMKFKKYNNGAVVIDRGFISTLSYNETRDKLDDNFDHLPVLKWFEKQKSIYNEHVKVIYLTSFGKRHFIHKINEKDPYGTVENQKLLEKVTLHNCRKYSKNLIVKNCDEIDIDEVIYEIIN